MLFCDNVFVGIMNRISMLDIEYLHQARGEMIYINAILSSF